ncbi:MAG TPA: FAD-binding oxidoreductase [Actinomycetota bacterium]|nr:FAD-binding oxidoreductase [Actinomycetota bacterium]
MDVPVTRRGRRSKGRPGWAEVVVVGAGTVGGWAAYFARVSGAERVVVLERHGAGEGASGSAAGVVRAQGAIPSTIVLGRWSIDFYRNQEGLLGTDSGFRQVGYLILAVRHRDVDHARARMRLQRDAGIDVRWVDPAEARALCPILAPEGHRGGTYLATDGYVDARRNVRAYTLALRLAGVELRERTPFLGLRTTGGVRRAPRVTGVVTPRGTIATERVILATGPRLRSVGRELGLRIPVGVVRHQVAVSEPHRSLADPFPMGIDLGAGLYWRPESGGGLLWGMSNPYERAGEAREIDWAFLRRMRRRLSRFIPLARELGLRAVWAASTEFTPDHLPIVGPAIWPDGTAIEGLLVASAGGHGMMWGPAVSRIAADLALEGRTSVVDVSELGLDRFDDEGRSRFVNPLALPFPPSFGDEHEDPEMAAGGCRGVRLE